VANPLSVKTKVQTAKATNAILNPAEREKVFLEVHIQNLTQHPMAFERIHFECVEHWVTVDLNKGLYGGAASVMPPQEIRQFLYVLMPKQLMAIPPSPSPGSIIPLGRLDISWTSSFGEPGRLLTSVREARNLIVSTQ
jgi:hypothetical protein